MPILGSVVADARGRAKKEGHKRSLGPAGVKVKNLQRGTAKARYWEEKDRECVGYDQYGEGRAVLQEKRVPSFPEKLEILSWLTKGKKRGPQDELGPFIVLKVKNLQRGTAAAVALGGKSHHNASAERDMMVFQADINQLMCMPAMRDAQAYQN